MSDISTVRASLKAFLNKYVRIDSWDLDSPTDLYSPASTTELTLPPSTAIALPVKDLQYERTGTSQIQGSGVFTYQITYRYPGELSFYELPTERCELLQQYLAAQSLLQLGGCGGIHQVQPDTEEYPVAVSRDEGEQDDWYIRVTLVLLVRFSVTELLLPPEFRPLDSLPDDLTDLNEINLKIYRSVPRFNADDTNDSTLDADITLTDS